MSIANGPGGGPPPRASRTGLCDSCEHQQLVRNTRGSTFSLCRRSRDDPAYPRYPRLPVVECHGYQQRAQPASAGD
jgi:hypothetical protein